jgi:hypothetical protein
MKRSLLTGMAVLLLGLVAVDSAKAIDWVAVGCIGQEGSSWHGNYYNLSWGAPVALVVPPTAEAQVRWSWGVNSTTVNYICPQFERNWPGPATYDPQVFRSTPRWPSNTDQFGVYYIRGPW